MNVIPGVSLAFHAPATCGQPFGLKRGGCFVMLEGVGAMRRGLVEACGVGAAYIFCWVTSRGSYGALSDAYMARVAA